MNEDSKCRTADNVNRQLNETRIDKFAFILSPHANLNPQGLICQMTIVVCNVAKIMVKVSVSRSMPASVQCSHAVARQERRRL